MAGSLGISLTDCHKTATRTHELFLNSKKTLGLWVMSTPITGEARVSTVCDTVRDLASSTQLHGSSQSRSDHRKVEAESALTGRLRTDGGYP